MPKRVLLKVYANPYCAEPDHEGRAHGHIRYEPSGKNHKADAALPFVGCRLIATPMAKGENDGVPEAGTKLHHVVTTGNADDADWDHVWEYDTEPALLPLSKYYIEALRHHGHHGPALLPADEATYLLVHGTKDGWRSPHARLHQYACERDLVPSLQANEKLLAASKAAHLARHVGAEDAPPEFDAKLHRDPRAEWHAFVGSEVVNARAVWESLEPTHKNFDATKFEAHKAAALAARA